MWLISHCIEKNPFYISPNIYIETPLFIRVSTLGSSRDGSLIHNGK